MKKVVLLLILLIFAFSINNIFSQEELPCENAINYGNINGLDKTGSIEADGYAWYYITITEAVENVTFSTCYAYTEFDSELAIFSNCEEEMDLLWQGEDECDGNKAKIFVERLEPGTYYIMVYGYDEESYGNYSLDIFSTSSSDANTCETAVNYGVVNGPSLSRTIFPNEEYWFYIDIPNNMQNILFSTYGTTQFDTEMEIWLSCDDGSYWKYNDDALNYPTIASEIYVEDLSAGTYYIKINGLDEDAFGTFTFNITDELPEFACLNAVDFGSINGPARTHQSMENPIFWYKLTTTEDYSNVLFSTCDATELDCGLVITTSCIEEDGEIGWAEEGFNCSNPEFLVNQLPAGTYYIGIYKWEENSQGSFSLKITSDATIEPTIMEYYPAEGENNAELYTDIYVVFNITIEENNFSNIKITYGNNQMITGISPYVTGWNNNVLQIDHDDLLHNTEYTVIIPGNSIQNFTEEISWSFRTMPDPNVLSVLSKTPQGIDNVLDRSVFVEFNMLINEGDNIGDVVIIDDDELNVGGVSARADGIYLDISHDLFEYGKYYTVIIPAGAVEDYNEEIRWSFSTVTGPPVIVSKSPENNQANVATNKIIEVTFDRPISVLNLLNIQITPAVNGMSPSGEIDKIKIEHNGFSTCTEYTVIIPSGTILGYDEDIEWSFNTICNPVTPEIISRAPGVNATDIALNAEVSVKFNKNITGITAGLDNVKITYGEDSELTGVSATVEGDVLKIAHAAFNYETEYTVNIPTGTIQDYDQAIIWKFKTIRDVFVPVSKSNEIYIYPNPSTGLINVEVSENSVIKIIDVTGKVIETKSVNSGSISNFTLTTGIYFVQIETEKDNSVHKVIINK